MTKSRRALERDARRRAAEAAEALRRAEEAKRAPTPVGNLLRILWRTLLVVLALPVRWPKWPKLPRRTYLVVKDLSTLTKYTKANHNPNLERVIHDGYSSLGVVPRKTDVVAVLDFPPHLDPEVLAWLRTHATRNGARMIYRHPYWKEWVDSTTVGTGRFRQEIHGEFIDHE